MSTPTPRPYGGRSREERAALRRRQFLDAGLELFGTIGYRAATVRQLCREAGVTDRYFYAEWSTTEDLLEAVYDECTARLTTAVLEALAPLEERDVAVGGVARVGLDAFLGVIEGDRRLARVVWFEVLGVSPRIERHYLASMRDFGTLIGGLLAARGSLLPLPEHYLSTMTDATVGAINHVTMSWVAGGLTTPRAVLVEALGAFVGGAATAVLGE